MHGVMVTEACYIIIIYYFLYSIIQSAFTVGRKEGNDLFNDFEVARYCN